MTNKTYWKYVNMYSANRNYNDLFDEWLKANYEVAVSYEAWNWGSETIISLETGEIFSDARVMQEYCKSHRKQFFNDMGERYDWIDNGCPDLTTWFNRG